MVIVGLIMAALTILQLFSTPRTEDAKTKEKSLEPRVSFAALPVFFKKTNWDRTGLYIIIRLNPITKNADPFLIDDSVGGMGRRPKT
jgi:hypothetical protein